MLPWIFFLFHNLWYAKVAPNASETLEGEIRRTLAVQMRYNKEMKKANATQSSLCWGITLFMLGRKKTSYAFLNRFTSSQMISGVCFFIFLFLSIFSQFLLPPCVPQNVKNKYINIFVFHLILSLYVSPFFQWSISSPLDLFYMEYLFRGTFPKAGQCTHSV